MFIKMLERSLEEQQLYWKELNGEFHTQFGSRFPFVTTSRFEKDERENQAFLQKLQYFLSTSPSTDLQLLCSICISNVKQALQSNMKIQNVTTNEESISSSNVNSSSPFPSTVYSSNVMSSSNCNSNSSSSSSTIRSISGRKKTIPNKFAEYISFDTGIVILLIKH